MANTIGQLVGIIKHTYSVKNDAGESVTVTSHFDCTHASDNDIRNWIASNRTIGVQRPARSLTASEITKSLDGATLDARYVGKKITSKREQFIAGLVTMKSCGMDTSALVTEWNKNHPDEQIDE